MSMLYYGNYIIITSTSTIVLYPHHFMLVAFSMHFVSDRSKHRTPIDLVPGTDDVDLAFEMIRIGTQCCYVIQQTTYAQRQFGGTEEKECQLVTFTLFII